MIPTNIKVVEIDGILIDKYERTKMNYLFWDSVLHTDNAVNVNYQFEFLNILDSKIILKLTLK